MDGRFKFWGGLTVAAYGGGPRPGAGRDRHRAARRASRSATRRGRRRSCMTASRSRGVQVKSPGRIYDITAPAVILAAGGFQGDAEMRTRYLGPGWELAKVRGTRFNTGDGIKMALDIGASALRQLLRLPCRAVGPQRAGVRRPRGRRRLPEAQLPLVGADQRQRQALRRRGRRLPQLHLRQVRPGGAGAARQVRLAGLRQEGREAAARRVPHQAGDQGEGRYAGGAGRQARGRRRRRPSSRRSAPTTPR